MKILLTGANGYIGQRLLPSLIDLGHNVVCCVRDKHRFNIANSLLQLVNVIEVDFLKPETLVNIPSDIDAAYYLMHSMSTSDNYVELERRAANNFKVAANKTSIKQVIYLSGISNEKSLSKHLKSRRAVEFELTSKGYNLTVLRAGIIIGSGSASFEIIRDLVEKLPVMIAPKWLNTKCQPIGIANVIEFLSKTLLVRETYNKNFDIGGPSILSYKQMLMGYSNIRGLNRKIYTVPIMTPKLSSYWLYFVTSTSYKLAKALVNSMKIEVICRNNTLSQILNIKTITYEEALRRTLKKIDANEVVSSWTDSLISGVFQKNLSDFLLVPTYGCFIDKRSQKIENHTSTINKIWAIGGETGWYYGNFLWKLRGYLDKLSGGVGLRRGRTHKNILHRGDAVDFWRVLFADKNAGRLLLFAEMKLPGEAWLEFKIEEDKLIQTATFRPKGVLGRLYWYSVLPFHGLIFKGMLNKLVKT